MSDSQLTADIGNGQYDMFIWGWGVEPNPDFQLSVFTCGQRSYGSDRNYSPGWSDSFYCNKAYDKLYYQQQSLDGDAPGPRSCCRCRSSCTPTTRTRALLLQRHPGLPQRQVHRVRAAAGHAGRPAAVPGDSYWSYRCIRPAGSSPSLTEPQHRLRTSRTDRRACSAPAAGGRHRRDLIGGIAAAVVVVGGGWLVSPGAARPPPRTSGSSGRWRTSVLEGQPGRCGGAVEGRGRRLVGPARSLSVKVRQRADHLARSCWSPTSSCSGCCPRTRPRT